MKPLMTKELQKNELKTMKNHFEENDKRITKKLTQCDSNHFEKKLQKKYKRITFLNFS